jgi:hypothetical protein
VTDIVVELVFAQPSVSLDLNVVADGGGGGGASALDDLTDVTITTPARFDTVMHDGSGFVNQPTQRAKTVVIGATVGAGGNQTIPDGTSFVLIFGSIGTVTLPSVVAHDGQMLTVHNLSGATITVTCGGSDLILPPGSIPTIEIGEGGVVEFSALDLTGIFGTFWIPGVRSGSDYNIPYFLGQSIPDGHVVAMGSSGTAPSWQDPNGLIDLGADPPWGDPPAVTTKVMRLDYAGNPGNSDGAWSTPEPANLTAGIDIRARIWFDYPSDVTPPSTDRYMELLTQEHPTADGGDTFEAAILWADDSFGAGVIEGQPHTFYESARVGIGTDPERNAGWKRAGLKAREWVDLRWTQDFGTNTVTYWRAVPFEVSDSSEQVDGIWWYPISSVTHADFGGIDTTATTPWWIGLRFTGYVSWMKCQNFARSTTYVDINAADLDALSLGATSFTDDAGNTWTTVAAEIVAAP